MQHKTIFIAVSLASLVAVAGLGGCATTADIEALRKEVHEANITAKRARDEALSASQMAGKASFAAEEARAMAEATDARVDLIAK